MKALPEIVEPKKKDESQEKLGYSNAFPLPSLVNSPKTLLPLNEGSHF
jgi:hypothetical protein